MGPSTHFLFFHLSGMKIHLNSCQSYFYIKIFNIVTIFVNHFDELKPQLSVKERRLCCIQTIIKNITHRKLQILLTNEVFNLLCRRKIGVNFA